MPTKVFDQLDATSLEFTVGADGIIYFGNDGASTLPLSTVLNQTVPGTFTLDINLGSTGGASSTSGYGSIVDPALVQRWSVNYARTINPVPIGAQVKKLVLRRPRTVNYSASGSSAPDTSAGFSFNDDVFDPIYFTPMGDSGVSPIPIVESIVGSSADEVLFDLTSGPSFITRQDLIDNWSEFNNNIAAMGASVGCAGAGENCLIAGSLSFGDGWTVTVTYEEGFTFTFPDPEVDGNVVTVEPGQSLVIEGNTLEVDEIETITLQPLDIDSNPIGSPISIPASNWTIVGNNLTFIVPDFPTTTYYAEFSITSTQFSGSITLGQKLVLYFYNAPGIYKFVPGQRFDTYYNRPGEGIGEDDTFNTAIPRPFAKTGYL